jgi:hypothetical protein
VINANGMENAENGVILVFSGIWYDPCIGLAADSKKTIRRMVVRALLTIAGALLLSACHAASDLESAGPQALLLDGATVMATDKTIGDHIVSFATGKNCSTIRKNLGKTYCEEDEVGHIDEVYCYRTIGDVTCYASPSPHGEDHLLANTPTYAGPPR